GRAGPRARADADPRARDGTGGGVHLAGLREPASGDVQLGSARSPRTHRRRSTHVDSGRRRDCLLTTNVALLFEVTSLRWASVSRPKHLRLGSPSSLAGGGFGEIRLSG